MSTVIVSREGHRDPGRVYPPPDLSPWDIAWRWIVAGGWYALGVFFVGIGAIFSSQFVPTQHVDAHYIITSVVDLTLGALMLATVWKRRDWRWLGFAFAVAAPWSGSGFGAFCWAIVALTTRRRWHDVIILAVVYVPLNVLSAAVSWSFAGATTSAEDEQILRSPWISMLAALVSSAAVLAILVAVGFYVGARRDLLGALKDRAVTAEREAELQVAAGQAQERARIAREMHDVLAHRISLVSMHAGVLAYREDLTQEQTREIAGIIQENAHASLTELRGMLGSLRGDGDAPALPQPTLASLPDLVVAHQTLGQTVHLDNQIRQPEELSSVAARHTYRIIQEALTNARKHAPGSPVWVTLVGRPGDGLRVEVRNALTGAPSGVPGGRLGLVGLQERASLVGGTLTAGSERGDFVVKAWLPWEK